MARPYDELRDRTISPERQEQNRKRAERSMLERDAETFVELRGIRDDDSDDWNAVVFDMALAAIARAAIARHGDREWLAALDAASSSPSRIR